MLACEFKWLAKASMSIVLRIPDVTAGYSFSTILYTTSILIIYF